MKEPLLRRYLLCSMSIAPALIPILRSLKIQRHALLLKVAPMNLNNTKENKLLKKTRLLPLKLTTTLKQAKLILLPMLRSRRLVCYMCISKKVRQRK